MQTRTFLIAYTHQGPRGAGPGRSFATTHGKLTQAVIEDWERQVREQNGFTSVAINNVVELEA